MMSPAQIIHRPRPRRSGWRSIRSASKSLLRSTTGGSSQYTEQSLRPFPWNREVLVDSQTMWLVMAAVVVMAIVAVAWVYAQRQRRVRLRTHFGPEYERAVRETGSPGKAEALLAERAKRVHDLKIHRLTREQADTFVQEWKRIQGMFVDDPDGAVAAADR